MKALLFITLLAAMTACKVDTTTPTTTTTTQPEVTTTTVPETTTTLPPSTTTTLAPTTTTTVPPTTTTLPPSTTTTSTTLPKPPTTTLPKNVTNVMKYGAVADGVTDNVDAFNAAIAAAPKGGTVYVPAGKYLFDVSESKYVAMKSNMIFKMDPNAVLMVKPNALQRYYLLNTHGATNVEIAGGQLVGERNKHTGTTGEWGFGIRIAGGGNLNIHDIKISDMWGDGICTGGNPKVVTIDHIIATNNRRQGLSITTGEDFKVTNSEFSYTNGTAPQYGIDLEPDNPDKGNHALRILLQGNKFHHNKAGGVQAYKNSQQVTIKDNDFSYQMYGLYTVGSLTGTVTGNTFSHHSYQGVYIGGATDSYDIHDNTFVNNSTKAVGVKDPDKNPVQTITGTSSVTNPHLLVKSGTNITVGSNKYQK